MSGSRDMFRPGPGLVRLPKLSIPKSGICFKAAPGVTIPAYGVFTIHQDDPDGVSQLSTLGPGASDSYHVLADQVPAGTADEITAGFTKAIALSWVNGEADVEPNGIGWGSFATNDPVWALYAPFSTPGPGDKYGVIPGTFMLGSHLPGFVALGPVRTNPDRLLVVRDTWGSGWWAKAASNWVHAGDAADALNASYVLCHPCEGFNGAYPYDGSAMSPAISLKIYLPRCGNNAKHPNVVSGNVLRYTMATDARWRYRTLIAAGSEYLDEAIGTILWRSSTFTKQGWAVADGTDNSTGNGGSGINLIGALLKGGLSAGLAGTFKQGTGADVTWATAIPYERLNNSG